MRWCDHEHAALRRRMHWLSVFHQHSLRWWSNQTKGPLHIHPSKDHSSLRHINTQQPWLTTHLYNIVRVIQCKWATLWPRLPALSPQSLGTLCTATIWWINVGLPKERKTKHAVLSIQDLFLLLRKLTLAERTCEGLCNRTDQQPTSAGSQPLLPDYTLLCPPTDVSFTTIAQTTFIQTEAL